MLPIRSFIRLVIKLPLVAALSFNLPYSEMTTEDPFKEARDNLINHAVYRRGQGVTDERVLSAMRIVPRHMFVPADLQAAAYEDSPLPIGMGQTISQPLIVGEFSSLCLLLWFFKNTSTCIA